MAIITHSIGSAAGRDFPTFAAWFAAIPSDVVASGNSYVGEMYNDSEFTLTTATNLNGKTTGPSNTITLKAAAGHSFKDHASYQSNPLRYDVTKGVAIRKTNGYAVPLWSINQAYFTIQGLQVKHSGGGNDNRVVDLSGTSFVIEDCILESNTAIQTATALLGVGVMARRCLIIIRVAGKAAVRINGAGVNLENCTLVSPSDINNTSGPISMNTGNSSSLVLTNCALFGFAGAFSAATSGNYNAADQAIPFGTNNKASLVYADQFENVLNASLDYRLKSSSALIDAGTPAGNEIGSWSVVPAPVAPTVAAPTIIGEPKVDVASAYTPGAVTGSPAPTVSQQWTLDGVDIPGATGATYTPVTGDAGKALRVRQIATNSQGSANATSASVVVVSAAAPDTTKPVFVSAVANSGTEVVLTSDESLGTITPDISAFQFNGAAPASITVDGLTVTLSGISPAYVTGNPISLSYTKPDTNPLQDVAGNQMDSFFALPITNNIPNRPTLPGYTLKLYGDDPMHDFSTVAALNTYINGLSLSNTTGPVMVWCYKDIDVSGKEFGPAVSDGVNFVTLRPAPGVGYNDIEDDAAALQYGTVGLEMTITSTFKQRVGMEITGWRIKQTAAATSPYQVHALRKSGWTQPGSVNSFHHNRVLIQHTSQAFGSGEYGSPGDSYDNLFIVDAASTAKVWNASGVHNRNTYVRLNGAIGYQALGANTENCVFFNCGGDPVGGTGQGNFTNTEQTAPKAGLTTVTGSFFVSASNYRPAAGTPMIGGATASAISKPDNNGNNRGLSPDAGAAQLVPAAPLATGQIVKQFPIDGQTLKITLTTNNATSGKISLTPADPANGAISIGPLDLDLSTDPVVIEIDDIPSGNYMPPTITLTNAGGTILLSGLNSFEVMGVGNLVYDSGEAGTGGGGTPPVEDPALPPTVSINVTMAGKRATVAGTVNLQGTVDGSLTLYAIPANGAPINLGAVTITDGSYTKASSDLTKGLYTFQAVAVANGQTVTATSPARRVLGLVGNFTLLGS